MKKEIIIIVVVVVVIVILNIFTSRHTNEVADEIVAHLSLVREGLKLEAEEQIQENIEEAKKIWDREKDKLSIYIEHEELEKVEMYMTNVSTDIETKEYNMAIESLDTCVFIIGHIKDKYELSLKNIF